MADSEGLAEDASRLRISTDDVTKHDAVIKSSPGRPQPAVIGNKRLWDITAEFRSAAATLPTGHLIKDDNFTLFESVAALEIMDPKMDSGLLQPGETLYDTFDVLSDLLPEEVIGIMDQLFQYEMAWHSGYPLSQSLFLCHYIDVLLWPEPKSLEDCQFYRGQRPDAADRPLSLVLRAYCIGLIKCCNLVNQLVLESHYFEEEDFSTQTFNRDLLSRVQESPILELLQDAIDQISNTAGMKVGTQNALIDRLSFRRDLLTAFYHCVVDGDEPSWLAVRDLAIAIENSHDVGKAFPHAFSSKIQRKLMSTVPPRPIIELSWAKSIEQMKQLCAECAAGFAIFSAASEGPEATITFLLTFSARKPEPLPFSRSYVSNALLERMDESFARVQRRELALLVLPDSDVLDESNWTIEHPLGSGSPNVRYQYAQILDDFASRAIPDFGGYVDFWKALCSNRCRLRRQLCHVLLTLDEVQRDGEDLDAKLEAVNGGAPSQDMDSPLFRYAYHFKLRVMEWIIQLGFQLEVYLPDEYAGMYWLLSSISRRREEQLRQIHEHLQQRAIPWQQNEQRESDAVARSMNFLQTQIELSSGTSNLAEALYTLYTYLHYLHLFPDPASKQPHYDAALRYELRMKPFLTLQDGFKEMFDDYQTVTHPFGDFSMAAADVADRAEPVCSVAEKAAKDVRANFAALKSLGAQKAQARIVEREWAADVSNLTRSTVAVGLAVSALRKAAEEGRLEDLNLHVPKPGERYHDYWIVPKLSIRLSQD